MLHQHEGFVAVARPMDGHYRNPEPWRVFTELFQDDPVKGSELRIFVLDRIWNRLAFVEQFAGIKCEIGGFTRPLFDIVMDVYETLGRAEARTTITFAKQIFGDRAWEFLLTLDRVGFAYTPVTIDDMEELQKPGPRRVGPLPTFEGSA